MNGRVIRKGDRYGRNGQVWESLRRDNDEYGRDSRGSNS